MDSVKHIHTLWHCIWETYLQNRDRVKSVPNKYDNIIVITYTSLTFKAEYLKTTKFISVLCTLDMREGVYSHNTVYYIHRPCNNDQHLLYIYSDLSCNSRHTRILHSSLQVQRKYTSLNIGKQKTFNYKIFSLLFLK